MDDTFNDPEGQCADCGHHPVMHDEDGTCIADVRGKVCPCGLDWPRPGGHCSRPCETRWVESPAPYTLAPEGEHDLSGVDGQGRLHCAHCDESDTACMGVAGE